jgi:hypothetical protein
MTEPGEHGRSAPNRSVDTGIDRWIGALIERHTRELTRQELLRAIRALSTRYVERRHAGWRGGTLDSAGKRAAFAGFFAPLHLLITAAVLDRLGRAERGVDELLDLGCGTGVASAAWALSLTDAPPSVVGVDLNPWVLGEARWNWRALGVHGRVRRGDLVAAAEALSQTTPPHLRNRRLGVVLGWSVNELTHSDRRRLLDALLRLLSRARQRVSLLIVEPIARTVSPWWDDWTAALAAIGATDFEIEECRRLPAPLAALDQEAGFDRTSLKARALWLRREIAQ